MTRFFSADAYRLNRPSPDECWGCRRPWHLCPPNKKVRRNFRQLTGLDWPGTPTINVPVRKDFKALGLEAKRIPAQVALCGKCSIAYMQAFNERKQSALDADRNMVRPGDKVILWGLLLKGQIASKLQEYAEMLEMLVEHHKAKVIDVILDDCPKSDEEYFRRIGSPILDHGAHVLIFFGDGGILYAPHDGCAAETAPAGGAIAHYALT
jgi:hypothetical protein